MSIESDLVNGLDFGRSSDILNGTSDNPMTELLTRLVNELIMDMRKLLVESRATGNLEQSIIPKELNPETIALDAQDAFYWKYVNYGVNGTKVNRGAPTHDKAPSSNLSFHDSITKWLGDKGIVPPEEMTRESYAYLIMGKLKRDGMEGTHFIDKVVTDQRINEMSKPISALLKESIIVYIKKPK